MKICLTTIFPVTSSVYRNKHEDGIKKWEIAKAEGAAMARDARQYQNLFTKTYTHRGIGDVFAGLVDRECIYDWTDYDLAEILGIHYGTSYVKSATIKTTMMTSNIKGRTAENRRKFKSKEVGVDLDVICTKDITINPSHFYTIEEIEKMVQAKQIVILHERYRDPLIGSFNNYEETPITQENLGTVLEPEEVGRYYDYKDGKRIIVGTGILDESVIEYPFVRKSPTPFTTVNIAQKQNPTFTPQEKYPFKYIPSIQSDPDQFIASLVDEEGEFYKSTLKYIDKRLTPEIAKELYLNYINGCLSIITDLSPLRDYIARYYDSCEKTLLKCQKEAEGASFVMKRF